MEDITNIGTVNATATNRQRYFNKITGILALKNKLNLTNLKPNEANLISVMISKILLEANKNNLKLADKLLNDLKNEDYSYIINLNK